MYRINSIRSEQWEIVDESGSVVFVGSPEECEETLDYQENLQPQTSSLFAWFGALFGKSRPCAVEPQNTRASKTSRPRRASLSWPELRMPRAH